MQNTALIAGSGATGFLVTFLMSLGVGNIYVDATAPLPPRAIIVNDIAFDWQNGMIGQDLIVDNGPIRGEWAATLWRGGKALCGGGGVWDYETRSAGNTKWMTPDQWTGDTCPALQPGDQARAVWEWWAADGSRKSTTVTYTLPKRGTS